MFVFLHGYSPDTWEGMLKNGLVGKNDGIRFCQNRRIDPSMKFNSLARKGGELYEIIRERNCPLYIDRLQGGTVIDEYTYDSALIDEYKNLLGDKFYGMQMHEWLSNYHNDIHRKLGDLPADRWTEENIRKTIYKQFDLPYLFLESMTLEEMAAFGKPEDLRQFYRNMTAIFKNRQQIADLVPCDSYFLAYNFELSVGVKRLMPEIGAQVSDTRVQVCYARGMTGVEGRSFGTYYEPWGGQPFTCCSYNDGNEWGYTAKTPMVFRTGGANGGSSRSLQRRIYLYSYLSNAEFLSEEWGLYNTFTELNDFTLSPYGKVKKEFLDFVRKYDDVGEKIAPIAAVISERIPVLSDLYDDSLFCGYPVNSPMLAGAKRGIRELFCQSEEMLGTETTFLKNSRVPDAVDLLNRDEALLRRYDWLIDLTGEGNLCQNHKNICELRDVPELLRQLLPCCVDGGLHWMVNKCTRGGFYLTVFNHSGIVRTVADGEILLPEAEKTVTVSFRDHAHPTLCAGGASLTEEGGAYHLTVPAGDFAFIEF